MITSHESTLKQLAHWANTLTHLHARLAPHFARAEPRRRALSYLQGLLSSLERKNGWHLAEHAREATPYGMQRLLTGSQWNADLVRNEVRQYVVEHLGHPEAVLALDETSFPKRGRHSAGVQIQYCGTTGQVENCQVGVFLAYVTPTGHTLVDRELYLPLGWTSDPARCQAAGIPPQVRFQTKCELARRLLERAFAAKIPCRWVVADSVYGSNLDLRLWLEAQHQSYVLAVTRDELIGMRLPQGNRQQVRAGEVMVSFPGELRWQRHSMSQGTKGPRMFEWRAVPILHQWEEDRQHWLLVRRSLSDPQEMAYYLVFASATTSLAQMVNAIGQRWRIEEDFETAKDLGLDHYQVRSWMGWYRHCTLVLLAHAFLRVISAQSRTSATPSPSRAAPLTVPELRHLLGHLFWPFPVNVPLVLAWSSWRCRHRARAQATHLHRHLLAREAAQSGSMPDPPAPLPGVPISSREWGGKEEG